jgi:hypothetical protein
MKTKKLVKDALKHPERWSWAELIFFKKWLEQRKAKKEAKRSQKEQFTSPPPDL